MEEVCEVGFKNLKWIFGLKNFSRQELLLVISRCRKSLLMSTPKPDNFMQLFWTFVDVLVWSKFFLYRPRIYMNTLLKLFQVNSWIFFVVSFFYWCKVQNKENIYKNLNNCQNYFFMLCSHGNSCFCLIVLKINVKVLGYYWVPYHQMFFLFTSWVILTVYWLV